MLLKKRSKSKIKKKIKKWNLKYLNNELDSNHVMMCWNSWVAHAEKCNSYNFKNKMINRCLFKDDNKYYFIKER